MNMNKNNYRNPEGMSSLPQGKKQFLLEGLHIHGGLSNWQTDDVGGWSMTPVRLAEFIFKRVNIHSQDKVLETCGGVGADTAVLGSMGAQVTTYEPDETRYKMLLHNNRVATRSRCPEKLEVHNAVCDLKASKRCNVVYLDVPWGGPGFMDGAVKEMFLGDLELGQVPREVLKGRKRRVKIVFKLPPTYNSRELQSKAEAAGAQHNFAVSTEFIVPPPHPQSGKIPKIRWFVASFRKTLN